MNFPMEIREVFKDRWFRGPFIAHINEVFEIEKGFKGLKRFYKNLE